MKRTSSALLFTLGLVMAFAPVASANADSGGAAIYQHAPLAFADLNGHYAQTAVTRLADIGLIDVSSAGVGASFQPNSPIDRTRFKQWFQKVTGLTVQDTNADLPNVTRVQAAEWLAQAIPAHIKLGMTSVPPFSDLQSLTTDQVQAVTQLEQTNVVAGIGDHQFAPTANLTTGDAAVLLDHILNLTEQDATAASYASIDQIDPAVRSAAIGSNQAEGPALYSTVVGNTRYVIVQAGNVPTSGYSVTIDSMQETAAGIFVNASLHAPDPGSMQAQHIEQPAAFATLSDLTKPLYLNVQDEDLMTANPEH